MSVVDKSNPEGFVTTIGEHQCISQVQPFKGDTFRCPSVKSMAKTLKGSNSCPR
jgi:hypothetical protein